MSKDAMMTGLNGYTTEVLFTAGEDLASTDAYNTGVTENGSYTPPGILDGPRAYELDDNTVRVLAYHELLNFRGYEYSLPDFDPGATLTGARVSYFDIDKDSLQIVDAGLAYNKIFDVDGVLVTDNSVFQVGSFGQLNGFSRFCSSVLIEAEQFGGGRGLEDRIYFPNEEDGGFFNPVGGHVWALDPDNGEIHEISAFGRGAWENVTEIDTKPKD